MNVYLTGDTHGRFERIACFCRDNRTTREDVLIILGDAGVNYYLNHRDEKLKQYIATMPITLLCIHGNHEARPTAALGYEPVGRFGGTVMAQREYPNLLFALDGEVYGLDGRSCIAIVCQRAAWRYCRNIAAFYKDICHFPAVFLSELRNQPAIFQKHCGFNPFAYLPALIKLRIFSLTSLAIFPPT